MNSRRHSRLRREQRLRKAIKQHLGSHRSGFYRDIVRVLVKGYQVRIKFIPVIR